MWPFTRKRNKPVNKFIYENITGHICAHLDESGIQLHVRNALAPPGVIRLRQTPDVYLMLPPDAVTMLREWFGNIDLEKGITYVENPGKVSLSGNTGRPS